MTAPTSNEGRVNRLITMNVPRTGTTTTAFLPSILVVDDTADMLEVLQAVLRPHYQVRAAGSGAEALRLVDTGYRPDLVLLDVVMPEQDGYQVLAALQARCADACPPVMFVTSLNSEEDETRGLAMGAVDYVSKPISPALLLARVRNQLELKSHRDALQTRTADLEARIERRIREIEIVQDVSILALANLAEIRDPETGHHLRRTQAYVELLAHRLVQMGAYMAVLTPRYMELLAMAAPLHDIGKVGVPDYILLHPGRLSPAETERMEQHCRIGAAAIEMAIKSAYDRAHDWRVEHHAENEEAPLDFLNVAKEIALYHHERWDGSGYPEGLAGEAIPLAGRLMAVADVFDSLVSWRIYKRPVALEEAVCIIQEASGTHFDPVIVEAFLQVSPQFKEIALGHAALTDSAVQDVVALRRTPNN